MLDTIVDKYTAVELSPHELRMLGMTSHEFFMEYFLADEIADEDKVQDFHILTFGRFVDLDSFFPDSHN